MQKNLQWQLEILSLKIDFDELNPSNIRESIIIIIPVTIGQSDIQLSEWLLLLFWCFVLNVLFSILIGCL